MKRNQRVTLRVLLLSVWDVACHPLLLVQRWLADEWHDTVLRTRIDFAHWRVMWRLFVRVFSGKPLPETEEERLRLYYTELNDVLWKGERDAGS